MKENVASEEEAYKGWSILIGNINKTGYTHSVPEACLAKPRDFMLLHHLDLPCLSTAVFAKLSYLCVPWEGWGGKQDR